ncbi:Zn(2)-C6 fungal-type domain-containing protein [Mycena kentingensis (nom. inval.)]|nr:Zn(2)-C6 fungal-type domain-containing protein [Mycena kentingensis (nom. inval.)]
MSPSSSPSNSPLASPSSPLPPPLACIDMDFHTSRPSPPTATSATPSPASPFTHLPSATAAPEWERRPSFPIDAQYLPRPASANMAFEPDLGLHPHHNGRSLSLSLSSTASFHYPSTYAYASSPGGSASDSAESSSLAGDLPLYGRRIVTITSPRAHPTSFSPSQSHNGNDWGYPTAAAHASPGLPFVAAAHNHGPYRAHAHSFPAHIPIPGSLFTGAPTSFSSGGGAGNANTMALTPALAIDVQQWPQQFRANDAKKAAPKQQVMACLFCRERKIGCQRPPEGAHDQTCNQCIRRKRVCTYPTESRRGHHARNRVAPRKFLGGENSGGLVSELR